ncbi:MAG: hypothetical protein ACI35S_09840 [Anaeroplasma sp.]
MKKLFISLFFVCFVFCLCLAFNETEAFCYLQGGNCVTTTYDFQFLTIRNIEITHTDAGITSNHDDGFTIDELTGGLYPSYFVNLGYKTAAFVVEMTVKRVNLGCQEVFFYLDDFDSVTTPAYYNYDLKASSSYKRYQFYFEVPIDFLSNNMIIGYSASGTGSDNWMSKNVKVKVGFSKETYKYSGLKTVTDEDFMLNY